MAGWRPLLSSDALEHLGGSVRSRALVDAGGRG